ncbi:MAG: flavodoxin family protein [Gemmatimonadota bacterium]
MAQVLALLMSGRPRGFTAGLLEKAAEGARAVPGVEVEWVQVHKYRFGPCTSCFNCIRDEAHGCTTKDAMGRDGELMAKVQSANGLIVSDPVHTWGPSAMCHLFVERCYPHLWSGRLVGMPFASISCASNQGMQRLARDNLCKWSFTMGFRYTGGLAVHTTQLARAGGEAVELGHRLGEAALEDARGRQPFPDQEKYVAYLDEPWSPLDPYLENLSNGTMAWEGSLLAEGLESFQRQDAAELLKEARGHFEAALRLRGEGRRVEACDQLVRASALWTHATWKEFLEEDVIGTRAPSAYRPIVKD